MLPAFCICIFLIISGDFSKIIVTLYSWLSKMIVLLMNNDFSFSWKLASLKKCLSKNMNYGKISFGKKITNQKIEGNVTPYNYYRNVEIVENSELISKGIV